MAQDQDDHFPLPRPFGGGVQWFEAPDLFGRG